MLERKKESERHTEEENDEDIEDDGVQVSADDAGTKAASERQPPATPALHSVHVSSDAKKSVAPTERERHLSAV